MNLELEPITDEESAELAAPAEEQTDEIEIDDDDEQDLAEETDDDSGVNETNYERYLPEYSEDNPPTVNALAPTGLFGAPLPAADAHVPYLAAPPKPQTGFEEGEGI